MGTTMTTPDILHTVGFEKTKLGSGDKESGYQIKRSSLTSLVIGTLVCFGIVAFVAVTMVYDVHFDLKPQYQQHRLEEHRTAKKLAQAQMALWSQYRDDIHESQEAGRLLKTLDSS